MCVCFNVSAISPVSKPNIARQIVLSLKKNLLEQNLIIILVKYIATCMTELVL